MNALAPHLEFGVLAGAEEIAAFEQEISVVRPDHPEYGSTLV